ncbi:DUF6461 domain-containing protein [Nocardia sp. CDC159]|uniref:DUF6461 domain-containing protein n=1 Tax=Nocardia pulmonis TaxID=2951408 RepID=A0A9X2EIQ3_9NOCA|nr:MULTISPECIES: DUF6461 domain-containing protein [Nocardia]MCM6778978.1 DUF6461 domain-containing protein [Nocardia pulmonis]MCM6791883.1 DUF6461 domain-containing protein [Nocardia sp. CDC159]
MTIQPAERSTKPYSLPYGVLAALPATEQQMTSGVTGRCGKLSPEGIVGVRRQLSHCEKLIKPVSSPSGEWVLRYDADGHAVIADRDGTVSWRAGAAGTLRVGHEGMFAVYQGNEVVWRADLPELGWSSFHVTNDGDGIISEVGRPSHSLLHGPVVPVSLGDRAPVAEIQGNRVLTSANGKFILLRCADGESLLHAGPNPNTVYCFIEPGEALSLDQPDTWLTWHFPWSDREDAKLVLVGPDDDVRWEYGRNTTSGDESTGSVIFTSWGSSYWLSDADSPAGSTVASDVGHVAPPTAEVSAAPGEDEQAGEHNNPHPWMETGLRDSDGVYCLTVIHNLDPDEALRRLGADDNQIATATWAELVRRAREENIDYDSLVVAAFSLAPHTLLVADNGWWRVSCQDLSRGTFTVTSSRSIEAERNFLICQDGDTLADFADGQPSRAWGAEPWMTEEALAAMGIDDPEAFDEDDDSSLDDIELLCQLTGVRPTVADVTGPARVIILPGE